MNIIQKSLLSIFSIIFIASCSNSMDDADAQQTVYFNQFIPCVAGPDYSEETMKNFVTEWNEFRALTPAQFAKEMTGNVLVDLRNVYEPSVMQDAGFHYVSIGR